MHTRMTPLAFGVALLALGCGTPKEPTLGKPVETKGTIKFADGSPLIGGLVSFQPVDVSNNNGNRFTGESLVNDKGEYKVGLPGTDTGLVPGDYKVSIDKRELGELPNSNVDKVPAAWRSPKTTAKKVTIGASPNVVDIVIE